IWFAGSKLSHSGPEAALATPTSTPTPTPTPTPQPTPAPESPLVQGMITTHWGESVDLEKGDVVPYGSGDFYVYNSSVSVSSRNAFVFLTGIHGEEAFTSISKRDIERIHTFSPGHFGTTDSAGRGNIGTLALGDIVLYRIRDMYYGKFFVRSLVRSQSLGNNLVISFVTYK